MTHLPVSGTSFLLPVSGTSFWSVCHGHKLTFGHGPPLPFRLTVMTVSCWYWTKSAARRKSIYYITNE